MRLITERRLTNQRQFICHCEWCKASVGPLNRRLLKGRWWQAKYGEQTKEFFRRVKEFHKDH